MSDVLAALAVVFVAELGDKTQLVALGLGARYRFALVVAGLGVAYLASAAFSVAIGAAAGAALPTDVVNLVGGLLFLGFAAWTLRDLPDREDDDAPTADGRSDAAAPTSGPRVIATVAVAMFVAELGDKTMIATATLAARGNPIAVWIGATVGIFGAGLLGAVVGRTLGDRLPERAIAIGAAVLFAVFGVVLLLSAR